MKNLVVGTNLFSGNQFLEEETYRILMNAVPKLPGQTQNVILLALEEKDNKEIVFSLSIVHTLKKIAYKRLREDFYCPVFICSVLGTALPDKPETKIFSYIKGETNSKVKIA